LALGSSERRNALPKLQVLVLCDVCRADQKSLIEELYKTEEEIAA